MIGHDVWTSTLAIAVTLFGRALFFSGLLLLFASQDRVEAMVEGMKLEQRLPTFAGGLGLLGLYFLAAGYAAYTNGSAD